MLDISGAGAQPPMRSHWKLRPARALFSDVTELWKVTKLGFPLVIHNHKDKENVGRNQNNLPYEQMITL